MDDNTVFEIDPELMAGFVDEAEEGLDTLDSLFVELEAEPGNVEIINSIFRPVHTIKGNSAFFGLMKVKKLAHEMESLLTLAKDGKLVLSQSITSVLLKGTDQLKAMLSRARDGEGEVIDEFAFDELIKQVISSSQDTGDIDGLWDDFFDKFEKVKAEFDQLDSSYTKQLETVFEIASQLKPGGSKGNDTTGKDDKQAQSNIPEPLMKIKSIFEQEREDGLDEDEAKAVLTHLTELKKTVTGKDAIEIIDSAIDEYNKIADNGGVCEALLAELLQEKIEKLLLLDEWKTAPQQTNAETAKPTASKDKAKSDKEPDKTMRVAESNIDNFLSYVGELIVVGEMYNYLQNNIAMSGATGEFAKDFKRINETFNNLSDDLQNSIMEIRKVPVRTVLQKAPRMIRDIATDNGKEIKVKLIGEEITIDKRHAETLDGPLTHMVRNSADHGIEMPDDREAVGKDRCGTVTIAVAEQEESITLTISDDGGGINIDAIKAKAVKLGMLKPEQNLTEEQLVDMLFASGVSTAEKVTEVSGRGVGMDVVKRNIDAANGKITVNTEQGKGTEFVIRLPKTVSTQIIDGFLVKLGENSYVIPMEKVQEVFRPQPSDISSVIGKGECVIRHEELLSVVKLSDVFGEISSSDSQEEDGIMVSTNIGKKQIAFRVDKALGVQKVVLKELDGLELNSEMYSAAAVMGDGTVAMVLDIERLAGITIGS